jgi:hypothetical protein
MTLRNKTETSRKDIYIYTHTHTGYILYIYNRLVSNWNKCNKTRQPRTWRQHYNFKREWGDSLILGVGTPLSILCVLRTPETVMKQNHTDCTRECRQKNAKACVMWGEAIFYQKTVWCQFQQSVLFLQDFSKIFAILCTVKKTDKRTFRGVCKIVKSDYLAL